MFVWVRYSGSLPPNHVLRLDRADGINFDWTATCTGVILKHDGNHGFGETLPGCLSYRGSITLHFESEVQQSLLSIIITNKYTLVSSSNHLGELGFVSSSEFSRYYTRCVLMLHVIDSVKCINSEICRIPERL